MDLWERNRCKTDAGEDAFEPFQPLGKPPQLAANNPEFAAKTIKKIDPIAKLRQTKTVEMEARLVKDYPGRRIKRALIVSRVTFGSTGGFVESWNHGRGLCEKRLIWRTTQHKLGIPSEIRKAAHRESVGSVNIIQNRSDSDSPLSHLKKRAGWSLRGV